MRRLIVGFLASIGFLTLLAVAALVGMGWWLVRDWRAGPPLPERFVLTIDLRERLSEVPPTPRLGPLPLGGGMAVSDVVLALDAAGRDPRVAGLFALVDDTDHGLGVAQELHAAIGRFRATGRFAHVWADSFGELSNGNEGYLLATAFEAISLQPVGLVGLVGIAAESPFLAEALASLGIGFELIRREEYKTALDNITETGLTRANREMLTAIVDDIYGQLADALAKARGLDGERARAILGSGPYTAAEARELGLVDHLEHRDEAEQRARRRAADAELVPLDGYRRQAVRTPAAEIALLRANGPIQRGSGGYGRSIAADDLAEALDNAIEDDAIRAILLRISSPGGSAVASETVARQIRRARAAGKPVVVSMGNVAASGGYWIAMGADRIVAQPGTLTGSIGVIAGKPVLTDLLARLEVRWEGVVRGEHAGMWSPARPFLPAEESRLDAIVEALYRDFKAGVAAGRELPLEEVDRLAKGRVWTGQQAAALDLVDRLGGYAEALAELRQLLGLPADAPLRLRAMPDRELRLREMLSQAGRYLESAMAAAAGLRSLAQGGAVMAPLNLR